MVDYFDTLGLSRRFDLDLRELEARYLERSREVHPDRHVGHEAALRVRAAGDAMAVNQAYRALRRPLARAEHLLVLEGVTIGDNEPVPPDLLGEMLELREALAEAKARAAQTGDDDELFAMEEGARKRERQELDALAGHFADARLAPSSSERDQHLGRAKAQVVLLRYLARYREAFEEIEEGAA